MTQGSGVWIARCGVILKNNKPVNWTNKFNKLFRKRPYGEIKEESYRRRNAEAIGNKDGNIGEQLS